jgi:hypothetical protein
MAGSTLYLFTLAAITFAFEYYLGILLYTLPVLQRRTKALGIALMRESPDSLVFLLAVNSLAAFLVQFQGDINQTVQDLIKVAADTKTMMTQCQVTIVNNTTLVGIATLIVALAVAIARLIILGIPFNPLQLASAAASATDTVANVYAPISQLLGLAIVTQTTLAAFATLMADNWTTFADIGVFLYIIPLRLTRRTATFLMTFGITGYVLIPLYAQVQKFILDWLNAQPQWFNWALQTICGPTLQTAIIDVTAPALYFGFLGWLAVGSMAGAGIRRLAKKGLGGGSPLSAATALRASALQAVNFAGKTVESTLRGQIDMRRAKQMVNQAAEAIKKARSEGRVIGLRKAEAFFDRARISLLTNRTKQTRQFALRAGEYAERAERPPDDDLSMHGSASAYITTPGDEYFDATAGLHEPQTREEERGMQEEEFRIRGQIILDDIKNARTPEQRLMASRALTTLQRQRIQHYTRLFGTMEIDEDELRAALTNVVVSRRGKLTPLAAKERDSIQSIIEAQKTKLRKRARETVEKTQEDLGEDPHAKYLAELEAQQQREEVMPKATAEPQEDEILRGADEIFHQMHQKTEDIVSRGISQEPQHEDTAESRLDKFLRVMKKPKKTT